MKSKHSRKFLIGIGMALTVISAAASAAEFAPAVEAGMQIPFGGARAGFKAPTLQFAAGYQARLPRPYSADADRPLELQLPLSSRGALLKLFDGKFSGTPTDDVLHVAGFAVTKMGNSAVDAYDGASTEPSWWSRNWGWVALGAVAAGATAALAGGGGVEINANNNGNGNPQGGGDDGGNSTNCGVSGDVVGPNPPTVDTDGCHIGGG